MAKTDKRVGSSSYFLSCFGFSRKIYSDKPIVAVEHGGEKTIIKKKKNKRSRWLSCFRQKNREIKPVSIEETVKLTLCVEDETDKQKHFPVISRLTDLTNIPADDKAEENQVTKEFILLERRKRNPFSDSQISSTRRNDFGVITTDRSKLTKQLGSSEEDTCLKPISGLKLNSKLITGSPVGKFDPVIGISIIILTLMIILIWGRLCAILCTSAWCYFLPRFRDAPAFAKRKRSGSGGSGYVPSLSLEDKSYQRKVVLNGFLGRQNRVSLL